MIFDCRFSIICRSLAVAVLACTLAHAGESIGPRANAFLVVDYLPAMNYEGDALSACFRIENAWSQKSEFEVTAKTTDAAGNAVETKSVKSSADANGFADAKFEFETRKTARIAFELKRVKDTSVIGAINVTLLRDSETWPATKMVNGRLTLASDGSFLIPLAEKKRIVEDRSFSLAKLFFGGGDDSGSGSGPAVAYAPGSWRINGQLSRTLGPWAQDGSVPILNAVNQILSEVSAQQAKPQRAAIVLPPEDLELATDPRTYRMALDTLLSRLARAGVTRTTLVAPFRYGCNPAHQKALWKEVHDAAAANSAKAIDPVDWTGEAQWLADPSAPKVFGPAPNAAGRKKVEETVAGLVK